MDDIQIITQAEANAIFDSHEIRGRYEPFGCFMVKEDNGTFTAIDNADGYAWTECFKHEDIARSWLTGDLDTDTAHELDANCTVKTQ
jgi:hypothetical protein